MRLLLSALLCFSLAVSLGLRSYNVPTVKLDFYYESLCHGCSEKINTEIYTIFQDKELFSITDISLVAYGNARVITRDPPTFECQHGEKECYGNMVELCAMEHYPNNFFLFVDCLEMKFVFDDESVMTCAAKYGLRGEDILKCSKGTEGPQLHLVAADKTPKHQYVPWIVINGEHVDADENIVSVICEVYTGPKPSICVGDKRMNVDIFYETHCPDCNEFFKTDVQYTKDSGLISMLKYHYYPFGNGKILTRDPPTFKCQHGEKECYGNMVDNCAIAHVASEGEVLDYLLCMENSKDYTDHGIHECSHEFFDPIMKCVRSDEGPYLMLKTADATPADHKYVPWILVDGELVPEGDSFLKKICKKYKGVVLLACRKYLE